MSNETTIAVRRKIKKAVKKTVARDRARENARDVRASEIAALMPSDMVGLLDAAMSAVRDLHAAVLASYNQAAEAAEERYEAIVWKLNDGQFFACRADEDSPGCIIDRHCAAIPGEIPVWGQYGEFIIQVDGVRALVKFGDGYGVGQTHFTFHAVDLDRPFISETGYRSHFDVPYAGRAVDEAAVAIFGTYLKDSKPRKIADADRDRLADDPLPAWCINLVPPASRSPATVVVPIGYVLVDVYLPPQKAYLARKWAEQAQVKIKADKADQSGSDPASPIMTIPCSIAGNGDAGHVQETVKACIAINNDGEKLPFQIGQRCEIVSIHHPCFAKMIGSRVVITKVCPDTFQVWAHDDKPVRYRINKQGRQVIDYDPKCVQSLYSFDQLKVLTIGEQEREPNND
jgi:hypothetical protein